MTSTSRITRTLLLGAVVVASASAGTGCSWFKEKTNYMASKETQPLEVPPGLSLPDTSAATGVPAVTTASGAMPGASATDINLAGSATDLYPKIGAALEGISGVTIKGRSEALGSYDVNYQGADFLVRVQDSNGGSRLMALSPDGRFLTGGAAASLMTQVKAKL
jgi:uncharacterized lipoprotein